jgi:putative membrane protein
MNAAETVPGSAFWREAFALRGAATRRVLPRAIAFAVIAGLVSFAHRALPWLAIRADVMEASGLVLGLLLVFRTAAGYDRWWEARKLWGAIINQSRNLAVDLRVYGPREDHWQDDTARWITAFAHAVRGTLQDRRKLPEIEALLGEVEARRVSSAEHMPTYVAGRIAGLLRGARDAHRLDAFAFVQADRERAALLDHAGGCERILKTPIPTVYSITIRRFVALYLLALPFALAPVTGLFSSAYAIAIAYPILMLEQIGAELQNPFVTRTISHIDIERLCLTIERNLMAADRRPRLGYPGRYEDARPDARCLLARRARRARGASARIPSLPAASPTRR